jgi:toxin HigB-1
MWLRSFRDRETEAIWRRQWSRRLGGPVQGVAWRKLAMLDAAETLADLMVPPGNRLEQLTGDRGGAVQHSDQPAVADLLPLVRREAGGRRDRGLSLRGGSTVTDTVMPPVHPGETLIEEFLNPCRLAMTWRSRRTGLGRSLMTYIR